MQKRPVYPQQPVTLVDGEACFKANPCVVKILRSSPYRLSSILSEFQDDLPALLQLLQLVGYPVEAYCKMPSTSKSQAFKLRNEAAALLMDNEDNL